MRILLLLSLIVIGVRALYEDQVGKFDWRARHVGCPNQVQLGRSAAGKDFLLVTSKRNALASINVNSGDIDWRQVQEINAQIPPTFSVYNPKEKEIPYISTLVNGGEYLRVFKRANGLLLFDQRINLGARKFVNVINGKSMIVVVTDESLIGFDLEAGEKKVSTPLNSVDYANGFVNEDGKIIVVAVGGKSLKVISVDQGTGSFNEVRSKNLNQSVKKCIMSRNILVCQDSTGLVFTTDINSNSLNQANLDGFKESNLHEVSVPEFFAISTFSNLVVYRVKNEKLEEVYKTKSSNVFDVSVDVEKSTPLLSSTTIMKEPSKLLISIRRK